MSDIVSLFINIYVIGQISGLVLMATWHACFWTYVIILIQNVWVFTEKIIIFVQKRIWSFSFAPTAVWSCLTQPIIFKARGFDITSMLIKLYYYYFLSVGEKFCREINVIKINTLLTFWISPGHFSNLICWKSIHHDCPVNSQFPVTKAL